MRSYPESVVHELIQKIYLASADQSRWPQFLETYREALDAGNAVIAFVDRSIGGSVISAYAGATEEAIRRYHDFRHLDPFATGAGLAPLQPGFIGLAQDLISDEELEQTEFYKLYGREHGAIGGIICTVYAEDPLTAIFGASRKPGRHFGAPEVALTRALFTHVRAAFQIHRQLHREREAGRAALATLNVLDSAVFVCDDELRILHSNAAAKPFEPVCTRSSSLVLSSTTEMARLRRAVSVASGGEEGVTSERIVHLRDSLGTPHVAVVAPVAQGALVPMTRPLVAVILHSARPMSVSATEALARTFGFTPAEARLADALAGGDSVRDAATKLGVTYETARTHLKRLLSKTGARRQVELVRILLTSLPPVSL